MLESIYTYSVATQLGNYVTNVYASRLNVIGVDYSAFSYGQITSITVRVAGIVPQT